VAKKQPTAEDLAAELDQKSAEIRILQRVSSAINATLDLEEIYGLPEGNLHQGDLALDQMLFMRPVPGWARYRTPVPNLYLCGSATHPGGGISGAPGYNASREIMKYWAKL